MEKILDAGQIITRVWSGSERFVGTVPFDDLNVQVWALMLGIDRVSLQILRKSGAIFCVRSGKSRRCQAEHNACGQCKTFCTLVSMDCSSRNQCFNVYSIATYGTVRRVETWATTTKNSNISANNDSSSLANKHTWQTVRLITYRRNNIRHSSHNGRERCTG